MFPGWIAGRLREAGIDAVAVVELERLRGSSDEDLFEYAQVERRAILTDNRRDFMRIGRAGTARGRVHHGLIFVNNRRYPRGRPGTMSRIAEALLVFMRLDAAPDEPSNREIWL
ncbi:MAG: DUF5615 family PIN-like protein [Actinomycetota bacterium]